MTSTGRFLAFGMGAVLLASAGAGVGFFVQGNRALASLSAELAVAVRSVQHAVAQAVEAPVTTAALAPHPDKCPRTTPVEPPWMDAGPIAPPSEPEAPGSLERRVAFWTRVWGELPDNYHLIVDERRPWVIHAEIDCRDLFTGISPAPTPGAAPDDRVVTAKNSCGGRVTQARKDAQAKWKRSWSSRESLKLYDGNKSLAKNAHENLLDIQGRKDALARAKSRAAPHLGHSEGLFALEEVPRIYARAAIVESLWRPEALSRSGAAGAYQFMPKTGAQYLQVDEGVVDERLDPLRSSWAAARYMHDMNKQMGTWPLTITAYNTGPARLKRVMKFRHTQDLGHIADAGDYGEFGFDGQNYYAQIVAIGRLTVKDAFDPQPVTGRAVRVEEGAEFADLAACQDIPKDVLARANPALHADVLEGRAHVPAGYVAYLPDDKARTAFNFNGTEPLATR